MIAEYRGTVDDRRVASHEAIRMLSISGGAVVTLSVAVGALASIGMSAPGPASFGMQWTLTVAGTLGLLAIAAGIAALRDRARAQLDTAVRDALTAVIAAMPAAGLHLVFQLQRLTATPHERWFGMVVGTSGAIEIGCLVAAIIVIADARRAFRRPMLYHSRYVARSPGINAPRSARGGTGSRLRHHRGAATAQ